MFLWLVWTSCESGPQCFMFFISFFLKWERQSLKPVWFWNRNQELTALLLPSARFESHISSPGMELGTEWGDTGSVCIPKQRAKAMWQTGGKITTEEILQLHSKYHGSTLSRREKIKVSTLYFPAILKIHIGPSWHLFCVQILCEVSKKWFGMFSITTVLDGESHYTDRNKASRS